MVAILAGGYGYAEYHRESDSVFQRPKVQVIRKPPMPKAQGAVREERTDIRKE